MSRRFSKRTRSIARIEKLEQRLQLSGVAFSAASMFTVGNGFGPDVAADLTGDGKLDLLQLNSSDQSVSVLLGNGDGTFQPARTVPLTISGCATLPHAIAVGALTHDGFPDLVVANQNTNSSSAGSVSILLANGDGTFKSPTLLLSGQESYTVAIGDLNGNDSIVGAVGSPGTDTLLGGLGNDTILKGSNDSVIGGGGNDSITTPP